MRQKITQIGLILMFLTLTPAVWAQTDYTVSSPDERVKVTVTVGRKSQARPSRFKLKIVSDDHILIEKKKINMIIKSAGHRYRFHKSTVSDVRKEKHPDFSSMHILTDIGITMEIRAYDDSVCYRYHVDGYDDEYQVTAVAPLFPHDRPQAIIGTYTQNLVLPWHTLDIDHEKEREMNLPSDNQIRGFWNHGLSRAPVRLQPTRPIENSRRILNWDDAPVTATAGITIADYFGNTWHQTAKQDGAVVDLTYKYLYGGLTFTPCQSLTYIFWGDSYWPFTHTMGSVHSWNIGLRLGASLPIQLGYNILNITPYCAMSRMDITQHSHRPAYPAYKTCHTMIGPGLKIQLAYPEQLVIGAGYELQYFHSDSAPRSVGIWSVCIGFMF
ncbi:MAG: hypothetical protein MJY59_04160 [Bacteroidaceae bacterium]|nr:hypothetical protein [Bacteroidaceae bacterium]